MSIYSITIEVIESHDLGFYKNYKVVAESARMAINYLFNRTELNNFISIDVTELQKLEDSVIDGTTLQVIEETGRSYFSC